MYVVGDERIIMTLINHAKKIMLVFGTRPEAIKMCPLVKELQSRQEIHVIVAVTGQHRTMLDQVLRVFQVVPDYDLGIMKEKQTLFDITSLVLNGMKEILEKERPDMEGKRRDRHHEWKRDFCHWRRGLRHV